MEYDPGRAPSDARGRSLVKEYLQCKWHVSQGAYTHRDLIDPDFINATSKSLLERAHQALSNHRPSAGAIRFKLVTNWRCDPADALSKLIHTRSHSLRVDQLFAGATARSASGQIRQLWRQHLGIDEAELRELAAVLGLSWIGESLEDMRDRLNVTCKAYGLRGIAAESSTVVYDDIIRQWAAQGRNVFDRTQFRQALTQEGLLADMPRKSILFGFKSFEHAFDRLEDRCIQVLNLVPEFDDRFIRDASDWTATLYPRLESFLKDVARSGERVRLAIDAHTTLAFTAGCILNAKSGRTVEIEQRTPTRVIWSPDDAPPDATWPDWDIEEFSIDGSGSDIAVAVGLTHDIEPKVRQYLEGNRDPFKTLLVVRPTGGPGSASVKSGAHAFRLAETLSTRLRSYGAAADPRQRLHLFIAAPNGFTFYLGRQILLLKPVTLYEFDFEGQRSGSYTASIALPESSTPAPN